MSKSVRKIKRDFDAKWKILVFFWSRFIISAFVESAAKDKRRKVIREKNHLGLSLIKAFMIGLWKMTYRSWYFIFGLVPTVSTSRYNQVKYFGLFSLKIYLFLICLSQRFQVFFNSTKMLNEISIRNFCENLTFLLTVYKINWPCNMHDACNFEWVRKLWQDAKTSSSRTSITKNIDNYYILLPKPSAL